MPWLGRLRRCIQTAEFLYPNNMLTVVDDLQEMDFGEFEGKSVAELEDNEDFGRWLADSAHTGGSSSAASTARSQSSGSLVPWALKNLMPLS